MTFKTWLKKIKRHWDPTRKNRIYNDMCMGFYSYKFDIWDEITEKKNIYPKYVTSDIIEKINNVRIYYDEYDFTYLRRYIKRHKEHLDVLKRTFDLRVKCIEEVFPQKRLSSPIDLDKCKFVVITDAKQDKYFGYVAHHHDYNDGVNYNIWGRFFNYSSGMEVNIRDIDSTMLIQPINRVGLFKRFMNLYMTTLKDKPFSLQISEIEYINDVWNKQVEILGDVE